MTRLNFLKESLETEIRALKENSNQKDIKYRKKLGKIESLQQNIIELQQQSSVLKYELEASKQKFQQDLLLTIENCKLENEESESALNQKITKAEQELESLKNQKTLNLNAEAEISKLQQINKDQQDTLTNTLTELHQKTIKINSLEVEISKLSDHLLKSNAKRELARNEIIKLTQRLESVSNQKTPSVIEHSTKPDPSD